MDLLLLCVVPRPGPSNGGDEKRYLTVAPRYCCPVPLAPVLVPQSAPASPGGSGLGPRLGLRFGGSSGPPAAPTGRLIAAGAVGPFGMSKYLVPLEVLTLVRWPRVSHVGIRPSSLGGLSPVFGPTKPAPSGMR